MTGTAEEFRALLRRGNLTGSAAGAIAGVNPRTIRRWIGGDSEIPYSAWALVQAHVDQESAADEFSAAAAALEAPPMNLGERFAFYRAMQVMQAAECDRLESDLDEARRALDETTRRMNQMAAQRGKLEQNP